DQGGDADHGVEEILDYVAGQIARTSDMESQQDECGDLGSEGLGGRDADFRSGVRIDAAVDLAGDGAVDDIADAKRSSALALEFAKGGERIGGFARLGDENGEVATGLDDRIAVAQL